MRKILLLGMVGVVLYFVYPMVFSNEISIDGYKIKAAFPETPRQKNNDMKLPGLGDIEMVHLSLKKEDISYTVAMMKMKDESSAFNEENMSPHSMLRKGAKLIESNSITVDGMSGKEYILDLRGREVTQQMFVDGGTMYTVVAIYKDSAIDAAQIFLDSVKFR